MEFRLESIEINVYAFSSLQIIFFPDQGICESRFNVYWTRSQSGQTHFTFFASYFNWPSVKFMTFCFKLNVDK